MSAYNNFKKKRKKIGWLCSYVPEELIMAAGLEPVRLKGEVEKVKEADSYIFSNVCPYVKNILDSGLRNKFKNVEGIIFTNSCDCMRRLYDVWTQYVETPFTYMLELPKKRDEYAIKYFTEQLLGLKTRLEEVFAVSISNDKLKKAVSLMNDHRSMITALFERQKEIPPYFEGRELLELCLEEATRPKDETTKKLKNFSGQAKPDRSRQKLPRILIMGDVLDKPTLFNLVENAGGSIVNFDTCYGLRHYSGLVEDGPDPIECLARRYLLKPPCARMPGFDTRIKHLEQLIEEYKIKGVIYSSIKFCDYSLFETPEIEGFLKRSLIPFLIIENDYLWGDVERTRNRVEAFLEVVGGELG
jgi:benzoyl-CoA reductase/2-hydroxyglutaryl-CoA dehydratase subunit BcrC/BadD/HgdB